MVFEDFTHDILTKAEFSLIQNKYFKQSLMILIKKREIGVVGP